MTYQLKIERQPTYLHAVVTGANTRENVARYMRDVIDQCVLQRCPYVLIEERLEGDRLSTVDIFDMVSKGAQQFQGRVRSMAYVDMTAEDERMKFAEQLALNREFPIKVFTTVGEAKDWLKLQEFLHGIIAQ